jgi:uncharacterized protein YqgC (DUF456 family)
MELSYLLWALAIIAIVVGIAGTILPALPGVTLVFAGFALIAYLGDFARIGWVTLTILGVLTVIAMAIDFLATLLGAKRAGASKLALIGAAIGSVVGIFGGLIGLIIFPFVGAVVGEWIARKNLDQASRVGFATWIGLMVGTLAKLAIALTMVGVALTAYFWN